MKKANNLIVYEQRKSVLQNMNLTPEQYEKALRKIARELKI